MTTSFILIGSDSYPVDTLAEIDEAAIALRDAGLAEARVWHGDPDDPDAYEDSVQRIYAAPGEPRCECAYCGVDAPAAVPPVGDDAEWTRQAAIHRPGCEWVQTRAHRCG